MVELYFLLASWLGSACGFTLNTPTRLCYVYGHPLHHTKFWNRSLKLRCDTRFQRAFTACSCVLKVITLVWSNQRNFENATACSKRIPKTTVATQLKPCIALSAHIKDLSKKSKSSQHFLLSVLLFNTILLK